MLCSLFSSSRKVLNSAFNAFLNPHRDDQVAKVGETLPGTEYILRYMYSQLERQACNDDSIAQLLKQEPLVNSNTLSRYLPAELEHKPTHKLDLMSLDFPSDSFGAKYVEFMTKRGYHPDERSPLTEFHSEPHLEWLLLRTRQVHDFLHTLTRVETTVTGELAIKYLEAIQSGLPMPIFSSFVGSFRADSLLKFNAKCVPWAVETSRVAKPFYSIYYEQMFHLDYNQVVELTGLGSIDPPKYIEFNR